MAKKKPASRKSETLKSETLKSEISNCKSEIEAQPDAAPPDEVAELFTKYAKYLAAGKANYARADQAMEQIIERCEIGVSYVLPAVGKKPPTRLTLIDAFADQNTVWAGSGCKRLRIEATTVKPQDR